MPRDLAPTTEAVSVASPEGRMFNDYWDTELLRHHLHDLSPADHKPIDEYVDAIGRFAKADFLGEAILGSKVKLAGMAPRLIGLLKWFKPTLGEYAQRYSDPFLRRAFPLVQYSMPEGPLMLHFIRHAYGLRKDIAWPVGGSAALAKSMEQRYVDMGGEVHYKQRVSEILTRGGRAVGVRLEDGSEHRAEIVISDADGRRTIMGMLKGEYTDEKTRRYLAEPDDITNWAVHVFLGVRRDLSGEPSALVQLLEKPVRIAGRDCESIEMQTYWFDPTMAPEGKGVIKVELFSSYSYWKRLAADRESYDQEKERVAETVIDILDSTHFPGIRSQVEAVDVPTLLTWERYVGGAHGFLSGPKKEFNPVDLITGKQESRLRGLSDFYLVGTWATSTGALFSNALSGRKVIGMLCERDGRRFQAP
jgi:phytoene dehydrogenase-like protein